MAAVAAWTLSVPTALAAPPADPDPDAEEDDDDDDAPEPGPAPRPVVTTANAPEPAPDEPGRAGTWKATGLPGRSAFHVPVAERDDPYGRRREGVPALSIDQITRFALDNPAVEAAEEKVIAMQALQSKAKFAWIPVVDTLATLSPGVSVKCDDVMLDNGTTDPFEFQFCRSGNDPNLDVQTIDGYFSQIGQAGVRLSFQANTVIPVFSFGRKLKHYRELGKAGVALAKLQQLATEQETILRVAQAHVTLLLAREGQQILREAKRVLDKAYGRVVRDLGEPGDWAVDEEDTDEARDPDDLTKIQLAAVELEVKMREALKVEALALAALWALGGAAAPRGFDVAERALPRQEVAGGLKPVATYVEIAGAARPEAKMASAAVTARKAQERLARAAFLPDMGVPVSFSVAFANAADPEMSQLYYQDGFNYSRFTAALALQWRWDTGAIFELRRARAELRSQAHQRDAAKLLLSLDVQKAYQDLIEARAKMDAAERLVALSWRLVLSEELSDAGGAGDAGDLLRALEKWYDNRFQSAQAIHAHGEALARLARAIGKPIPTRADVPPEAGAPAEVGAPAADPKRGRGAPGGSAPP